MNNKYGYKEIRKLSSDNLRNLCIKHNWYTKGNNEEYERLLNMCNKDNIDTDTIVEIAQDILDHSKTERTFVNVCFEIGAICHTYFEEV